MKKISTLLLAALLPLVIAPLARPEVIFGYRSGDPGRRDMARRGGRFFASSDYGDAFRDWGLVVHSRDGLSRMSYNPFWMNDGTPALFGVEFPDKVEPFWPEQFERFPGGVPQFDRAVIQWGANVPAPGAWAAGIRTPDGRLHRIAVDSDRTIHPDDRTTVRFDPTPLSAFYVGIRNPDPAQQAFVSVSDIRLYLAPDERHELTNAPAVWHPGAYLAVFNPNVPGEIQGLTPVNAYASSHHTLFYHGEYIFDLFFRMAPVIRFGGETLLPAAGAGPVQVEEAADEDRLRYGLTFALPGQAPVEVAAEATFRVDRQRSIELRYQAANLPEGATLGFRFHGPAEAFGERAGREPVLTGTRLDLTSLAGRAALHLRGADRLELAHQPRGQGMPERVRFETVADGPEMELVFSLPIGLDGRPQPALNKFEWREAGVAGGDPGIAPFKASDLDFLEEIRCGDPNDPHPFYDLSNDPVLQPVRDGKSSLSEYGFHRRSNLDDTHAAAVPVTTVLGAPVRALPAAQDVYFRYELESRLRPQTPYLIVIEHAFDQRRRGTFHSVSVDTDNNILQGGVTQVLRGGLETGPENENTFKTESVLCFMPLKPRPSSPSAPKTVSSIVFSPNWAWQGWGGDPGPAVKTIRLYRVRSMPALPDLAPLLPAPERRRNLTVLTEMCGGPSPWWLFEWHRLVGYDAVWTYNDPMSHLLGGSSNLERTFHPGLLPGNRLLFEAAADQGLALNIHLGQLLNLGFGNGDVDSFTGSFHGSYNGERVPFKPTEAERTHIASALEVSLGALARYPSLRDVSLADDTEPVSLWTQRNLEDFRRETGAPIEPTPLFVENAHVLLEAGPEVVRQWQDWASRERRAFHGWLLREIRRHRPDLRVVLSRHWYRGMLTVCNTLQNGADIRVRGVTPQLLEQAGIHNFLDFLRFTGIDPDLYRDEPGFSLEIEADARLRVSSEGPLPDYYDTDWFSKIRQAFASGGLSVMVNYNYDENIKPLRRVGGKVMTFFKNREEYRRGLVEALLHANARNLTLPTYVDPWSGRIDDLRQFAIPYRLLPFAEPEPFAGTLRDSAGQARILQFGNRCALVNAGPGETIAALTFPPGTATIADLSEGQRRPLAPAAGADGHPAVSIAMQPWSLKTLEWNAAP